MRMRHIEKLKNDSTLVINDLQIYSMCDTDLTMREAGNTGCGAHVRLMRRNAVTLCPRHVIHVPYISSAARYRPYFGTDIERHMVSSPSTGRGAQELWQP